MMTLMLDPKEQEVLAQVMEHALATVEIEIRRTDHAEFKQLLKTRRDLLKDILGKIEASGPVLA